jgi:hypothetical protein
MRLIPDDWTAADLYEFHWLMKLHGQRLCTTDAPPCSTARSRISAGAAGLAAGRDERRSRVTVVASHSSTSS